MELTGELDLRHDRSAYHVNGASRVGVIFAGAEVYALLPQARPDDARPWIATTLDKHLHDAALDPASLPASLAGFILRPSLLLDFLDGALTGSIRSVSAPGPQGSGICSYHARFLLPQALTDATRRHYSQRQQDDVAKVLEILSVQPDALHDGTVELDRRGLPRRLQLDLKEQPAPQSTLLVHFDIQLTPATQPVTIDVPADDAVVRVPTLFQFLTPLAGA